MRLNKALFLDLDGTLITTRNGNDFPKDKYDWKFIGGIVNKLSLYSDDGYVLCIVSNQGGIELGYETMQNMEDKMRDIVKEIEQEIGRDVNYVFCPSMNSYHRKPNPGMAYQMAIELNLDLKESIMVGDTENDKEFAENAGIGKFIYAAEF